MEIHVVFVSRIYENMFVLCSFILRLRVIETVVFFIPSSCFRSDVVIFFKFSFLFLTWSWFGKRGVYDL